jgi:hypothetical protein
LALAAVINEGPYSIDYLEDEFYLRHGHQALAHHAGNIEPRTITGRDVELWQSDARLLGGVALCMHYTFDKSAANKGEIEPLLWYNWAEWNVYLSSVKDGSFDAWLEAPDDFSVSIVDTKEMRSSNGGPLRAVYVQVGWLRTFFEDIGSGAHDNPPPSFSTPDEMTARLLRWWLLTRDHVRWRDRAVVQARLALISSRRNLFVRRP